MIPKFYLIGSQTERPSSKKTIYADGAADAQFREGIDLELSHWLPNRTPDRYKADTSTEICMNFVQQQSSDGWELAINNHLDVDGILAVFTLVHSEKALQHRDTIVQAAEMGDFWAWGEQPAQVLFQGLTLYFQQLRKEKVDPQEIYRLCFAKIHALLDDGASAEPGVQEGLTALQQAVERVQKGLMERTVYHDRFVHYNLPRALTEANLAKALHVPPFNAPLADDMWLWPAVRDRWDSEKVHLVSAQVEAGWYYDLWYPGYMWADTPDSWRAPGLQFNGSTNGYCFGHDALQRAVAKLQSAEEASGNRAGSWVLVRELSPFSSIQGRNFPVVLSFLSADRQPLPSHLPPHEVAALLADAF